jgi:1-acyl-sn-glycerol-3-phosphate acyltransferase
MMAKEYFSYKAMQWVFNRVGVILVDRGNRDMAATRAALRALDDGYVLGVFPEGKIETSRDLLPFQSGIGLLALKSGAPVFPAYLDGTQRQKEMIQAVIQSNNVSLSYGPQIAFNLSGSGRQQMEQIAQKIHSEILRLRNSTLSAHT